MVRAPLGSRIRPRKQDAGSSRIVSIGVDELDATTPPGNALRACREMGVNRRRARRACAAAMSSAASARCWNQEVRVLGLSTGCGGAAGDRVVASSRHCLPHRRARRRAWHAPRADWQDTVRVSRRRQPETESAGGEELWRRPGSETCRLNPRSSRSTVGPSVTDGSPRARWYWSTPSARAMRQRNRRRTKAAAEGQL